jgi:hypothetical protein
VRTPCARQSLWATEQALASNSCGAVLAWPKSAKYAELRRLQIAAEGGRASAFLFRSPEFAGEPSPAPLRIALGTASGGLAVRVLKRRGAPLAQAVLLRRCRRPRAAKTIMWIAVRLHRCRSRFSCAARPAPEPALEERHRVFACDRRPARAVRAGMAISAALASRPG